MCDVRAGRWGCSGELVKIENHVACLQKKVGLPIEDSPSPEQPICGREIRLGKPLSLRRTQCSEHRIKDLDVAYLLSPYSLR